MNNRFKFRIWDKKDKEYLDPDYYEGCYLLPNGKPYVGMTIYNGLYEEYQVIPPQQLIVEHCTGLADKNGKLIYEGDVFEAIVLNSCDCDENIGKRIRGQVAYFTDNACFTFAAYSPINFWEIEIIGNIHDNQFRDFSKMLEEK